MKINDNGIIREMTEEEIAEMQSVVTPTLSYAERVVNRIREVYSVDDEIAMFWKDPNDPDVVSYRAYVEKVKAEEKLK